MRRVRACGVAGCCCGACRSFLRQLHSTLLVEESGILMSTEGVLPEACHRPCNTTLLPTCYCPVPAVKDGA